MRIGIQFDQRGAPSIESILDDFRSAEQEGFDAIWLGQVFDHDILTLYALAGTCTERIELGTSVVPFPTRHPTVLAQQALTTQLATNNRLTLGIGFGHDVILDKKLGLASDHPLARTREVLEVLRPLLRGEYVKYAGEYQRMRVDTPVAAAEPPDIILAALGPRMIELAGELADGVTLVFAGARFIAESVRPRLPDSARIVASVPVAVTDEPKAVKAGIDFYTRPSAGLPAYQRTMAAQKIESVSELGFVGSAAEVEEGLDAFEAAGVTDLNPILMGVEADPNCVERTRELLASRAGR
jgi:F420-dependent oxidoreductase-like protein